jgi:uncharacterized phiE125 gp8 family phage protein
MAIDAAIALITLADAKAFLKVTASTDDTIIADLVNEVSSWVANFIGRPLILATYIEYYDGQGTPELILRRFPVVSITNLNRDDARLWASATDIDVTNNALVDLASGIIRLWHNETAFYRGHGNIRVTYTAGWTLAQVPYAIQLAVRKLVSFMYHESYVNQRVGVASESQDARVITYLNEPILKDVEHMLKPYQSLVGGPAAFS